MINDKNTRHDHGGFDAEKEEFLALCRQMQLPEHRDACQKLFDASADELNASFRPNNPVITSEHIRAGLKWFFEYFSTVVNLNDNDAARLLNSAKDDLVELRNEIPTAEFLASRPDLTERLSLLLGIYGAIARIAPDGDPSDFVYSAFRKAHSPSYGGKTLIEYLLSAKSLDAWYIARRHLRILEAEFLG